MNTNFIIASKLNVVLVRQFMSIHRQDLLPAKETRSLYVLAPVVVVEGGEAHGPRGRLKRRMFVGGAGEWRADQPPHASNR